MSTRTLVSDQTAAPFVPDDLPERTVDTYTPPSVRRGLFSRRASIPQGTTWELASPSEPVASQDALTKPAGMPQTAASPSVRPNLGPDAAKRGYELIERLGAGGMGEVWVGLQSSLDRPVAVKRLLPHRLEDAPHAVNDVIAEFRLEAVISARLEHPNIVPVHDLDQADDGNPLMAMKMVEGTTWSALLAQDFEAMSAPDFLGKHLPILVATANAVAYAHDRGIVYRDIKPAQVMVGEFGEVLLADWGLALAWKDTRRKYASLLPLPTPETASNPAGTPAMMAPEQTDRDPKRIGPHTDIFLLGATLFFLLTGTYPYQAPSSQIAYFKALAVEHERPEVRTPLRWVPKELSEIAMKAMAPAPENRYPNATAFRQALTDWMTGAAKRREAQSALDSAAIAMGAGPNNYDAFDDIVHNVERAMTLMA